MVRGMVQEYTVKKATDFAVVSISSTLPPSPGANMGKVSTFCKKKKCEEIWQGRQPLALCKLILMGAVVNFSNRKQVRFLYHGEEFKVHSFKAL
jgi:hypothetical protein